MNPVERYILGYPNDDVRELLILTHDYLLERIPGVKVQLKWKIPTYGTSSLICYLNPKTNFLILGFMKGIHLDDPDGILVGQDLKLIRHLKIEKAEDLFRPEVDVILENAIQLSQK